MATAKYMRSVRSFIDKDIVRSYYSYRFSNKRLYINDYTGNMGKFTVDIQVFMC